MSRRRGFLLFTLLFIACNSNVDKKAGTEKDSITTKKAITTNGQPDATNETQTYATGLRTDTLNLPIGRINGVELVYDCRGCTDTYSDSVTIYYKQNDAKKLLFTVTTGDNYIDEVSCFKHNGYDFIYVGTQHTYGHSAGYLYYLNTAEMKAYEVKMDERKTDKVVKRKPAVDPDTLEFYKSYDLTKNEKDELGGGARYRSERSGLTYYHSWEYLITKVGENKFVLEIKDGRWETE